MALVLAMADGDQTALANAYDQCIDRVYGLALRISGRSELAESIAEAVFLEVWTTAASFDSRSGTPLAWMLGLCRQRALDAMRVAEPAVPDEHPSAPGNALQDLRAGTCNGTAIHAAICRMENAQQHVLGAALFGGLSASQIAVRTGLPQVEVAVHLRKAIQLLRSQLPLR